MNKTSTQFQSSGLKVKNESESRSVMATSLRPHRLYSPWNSLGQNTGVGNLPFLSLGDLPNPGIEPESPELQALPAELLEKPKLGVIEP